jgi:hypothetical protein
MPTSVMASTCFIANTLNKALALPAVVHTPPATGVIVQPDYTVKNTGRNK